MNDLIPPEFHIGCGDTGNGAPLVLLHCSGADRSHWGRLIAAMSRNRRPGAATDRIRFLTPEFFGCGETRRFPAVARISLEDHVRLVATATAHVDKPIDLVGHSFGGAVALQFARRMPERVRTLTLVEPAAFHLLKGVGVEEDILFRQIARVAMVMHIGASVPQEEARLRAMACFVDYWNGEGKWTSLPEPSRAAMADMVDVISGDFRALFSEPTSLNDCRELVPPVLLIGGDRSPAPVRRILDLLQSVLPVVSRVDIAGAGHMIPLSHAEPLAASISSFIGRGRSMGISDPKTHRAMALLAHEVG